MEPLLGQIELFHYGAAPRQWAHCDGRELSIYENQALFSLLGTRFGGNGTTTFALPDLRDSAIRTDIQYYIALHGEYPKRNFFGFRR